jgi:transcriptional regulator with XRE-family HTH domain
MVSRINDTESGSPALLPLDYDTLAVELVRALRGRRSLAAFSRRMGYRSNVAQRWESRRSWPSAADFLALRRRAEPRARDPLVAFFRHAPAWLAQVEPESRLAVAAFLRQLRGKAPIAAIAERGGFSRYQVSRWLSGATEPPLPAFLCLVELSSRRLLDLLALLGDPERLPSITRRWQRLELARRSAYDKPWSHGVLRALELETQPAGGAQLGFIAKRLSVDVETVKDCLATLEATGQVYKQRRRYLPRDVLAVHTAQDPELSRGLRREWTRTALGRLERGAPGSFGYSLFAVSKADLRRLRELHLQYVRAMQELIARSEPNECVGLFCAQLLDLAEEDNALG